MTRNVVRRFEINGYSNQRRKNGKRAYSNKHKNNEELSCKVNKQRMKRMKTHQFNIFTITLDLYHVPQSPQIYKYVLNAFNSWNMAAFQYFLVFNKIPVADVSEL